MTAGARRDDTWRIATGFVFLAAALWLNYLANSYAAAHAGPMVPDLFLSLLPVTNVNFLFSEGSYVFVGLIIVVTLLHRERLAFILKSVALFIVVRSFFISLTHLGAIQPSAALDGSFPTFLSQGYDYFFSGHTGLPLLFSLIFWDRLKLRYLFLTISVAAGAIVLLGHLHYSIDVFAAPFITYGIYQIAKKLFATDYRLAGRTE